MLSHPLSYPHRYLRTFSIECGRMRVWSCLHSLFHSFWPGCRQIGQLKELIKLTTRIWRTFGHFHLLYIFIIIFFFLFVCLVPLLNFILSVFVGPSFCVILADMTWTVVYLLFLCASFFFWLLFILFISLTHANMFVCVCVCVCESGHALTHTHLYVLYFIVNCLWHLFRNCFPLFCHFICSAGASVPAFVHLFIYLISFYFMTIFRTYHINCFCFLHFFQKDSNAYCNKQKDTQLKSNLKIMKKVYLC